MSKNDMLNIPWNRKNIYHWEMVASPLHIGKYGYTYVHKCCYFYCNGAEDEVYRKGKNTCSWEMPTSCLHKDVAKR